MSDAIYLRPVGRVSAPHARTSGNHETILSIGGRDDVGFAAIEVLRRSPDGSVERRIMTLSEVRAMVSRGGADAGNIDQALACLARPRAAIAGLPLDCPRIMGIVNVTPDSFSDGGNFSNTREAIAHARRLNDEGADILDIGGESTRPGSEPVTLDEELRRVMPVVEGLVGNIRARISIDTRKAEVMRRAAAAGAHIVNDVSALTFDPASLEAVAETKLPVVLMHAQGDPKTMQVEPRYSNVLLDVYDVLAERIAACRRAGISGEKIIVDPGIGFGKTLDHNLELLSGLSLYLSLGVPVLLGVSRKRMIGTLTGIENAHERVMGSVAAALSGIMQGANMVRVHDVAATRQSMAVWEAASQGVRLPSDGRDARSK